MKVLIASNNTLVRSGIQFILNDPAQLISSFSHESPDRFLNCIQLNDPQIIFFDKNNDTIFTIELLKEVRIKFPFIKVIVISGLEPATELLSAIELGIDAYLTYECDQEEIQMTITNLKKHEKFYCQKVLAKILEIQQAKALALCNTIQLTERETEVAIHIAEGNTNKEIAEILCISPHTVHTHRKSLMKKLGVNSATDVARFAMNEGLIK